MSSEVLVWAIYVVSDKDWIALYKQFILKNIPYTDDGYFWSNRVRYHSLMVVANRETIQELDSLIKMEAHMFGPVDTWHDIVNSYGYEPSDSEKRWKIMINDYFKEA